jgi:hypothetical protein
MSSRREFFTLLGGGCSRQIGPAPAYNAGWLRTPEMVQGVDPRSEGSTCSGGISSHW